MREQIRGLEQAKRNIQDGISLIQTAEGALGSIHDILQRMNELAVQAANGTYSDDDRKRIQGEFVELKSEIDNIAKNTEFNGVKLLKKSEATEEVATVSVISLGAGKSRVEINTPLGQTPEETADNLVEAFYAVKNGLIGDSESLRVASEFEVLKQNTSQVLIGNIDGKGYLVGTYNTFTNSGSTAFLGLGFITIGSNTYSGFRVTDQVTKYDSIGCVDIGGSPGDSLIFQFNGPKNSNPTLTLQIGANSGQTLSIELTDGGTTSLGIDDTSVITISKAESSISKINSAIQTISSKRSKFGAYQNRLEHAMNNVSTYTENLTAAESRIRDIDMAKEMMVMIKQNILMQSSQAMLAQANQLPNGVLNLLK